jgi:NAD(P)-dependent dehydrogenase (short-subunit alcohol dehydrogenase family)
VVGAGRGIGAAVACRLALEGASVVVADVDGELAEVVATNISDAGGMAVPGAVDVEDDASVSALMAGVVARFGRLDLLSNNVAAASRNEPGGDGDIVEISLDGWERAMRINLRGMVLACRHAIPRMLDCGGGAIVNMSSAVSRAGERRSAYNVSKTAINGLTRHIAAQWGKQGIRANAVAPGLTLTDMALNTLSSEQIAAMLARVPVTRLAVPDDIAAVVAFLLSDDAAYLQGQVLFVDGGASIRS